MEKFMNDEDLKDPDKDAGTMTQEEAIKHIEEATRKIPTKVVRTQADIDDFYDDVWPVNHLALEIYFSSKNKKPPKKVASCTVWKI